MLSRADLMQTFAVLYQENHGGTFNGVLETIHLSLEEFLKDKLRELIPNVVLDHRTQAGYIVSFLRGQSKDFYVLGAHALSLSLSLSPPPLLYLSPSALNFIFFCQGACCFPFVSSSVDFSSPSGPDGHEKPNSEWIDPPYGGIFTNDGGRFIERLISGRNNHTHEASAYPVLANFRRIKLAVGGTHVLVFNPTSTQNQLIIDTGTPPTTSDDACLMILRPLVPLDQIDMDECEQNYVDLFLECLTKLQYVAEYPNGPDIGSGTHALVLCYGTRKFFVPMSRRTYELLHGYFGYQQGARWKTHYFQFRVQRVLARLVI